MNIINKYILKYLYMSDCVVLFWFSVILKLWKQIIVQGDIFLGEA